jgi:hypothetical protein
MLLIVLRNQRNGKIQNRAKKTFQTAMLGTK